MAAFNDWHLRRNVKWKMTESEKSQRTMIGCVISRVFGAVCADLAEYVDPFVGTDGPALGMCAVNFVRIRRMK